MSRSCQANQSYASVLRATRQGLGRNRMLAGPSGTEPSRLLQTHAVSHTESQPLGVDMPWKSRQSFLSQLYVCLTCCQPKHFLKASKTLMCIGSSKSQWCPFHVSWITVSTYLTNAVTVNKLHISSVLQHQTKTFKYFLHRTGKLLCLRN